LTAARTYSIRDFAQRAAETKAWAEANPALAEAWCEANKENAERSEAAERAAMGAARTAQALAECPRRLIRAGAPERNVTLWVAGLEPTPAWDAVKDFVAKGRGFALLTGDTGVGKTSAAVGGMALRLLEDKREDMPVLFVRAVEGARMGLYDAEDKKLAGQMLSCGLLVLDDLGAEFLSDGSIWRSILDEVIDTRYGDRTQTIITTNLDGGSFKQRYGARIADRIRHAGEPMPCGAVSLRKRGEG